MDSLHKNPGPCKRPAPSNPSAKPKIKKPRIDERMQLVNDGKIGPIEVVSLPEAAITSLRGILLDFDLRLFRKNAVPDGALASPRKFYEGFLKQVLDHSSVFRKAEVRISGRGLHVIVRFDRPIEFESDADRQRWTAIVKVIQKLLPTDPDCPGITALTRPLGSINSKNDAKVKRLFKGEPVLPEDVIGLFDQARLYPFRTIVALLFGYEHVSPCPVCNRDGYQLDALDGVGICYGGCGKVRLGQIFDVFLKPRLDKKRQ